MTTECTDHGLAGNSKGYATHRQTWISVHGPIPKGMVVMHECDNPRCINLDHLRLGTYSENTLDAVAKGHLASRPGPKGEANVKAKLTDSDIRHMRMIAGRHTRTELGRMFGVSQSTASKIVLGHTWRHVDD